MLADLCDRRLRRHAGVTLLCEQVPARRCRDEYRSDPRQAAAIFQLDMLCAFSFSIYCLDSLLDMDDHSAAEFLRSLWGDVDVHDLKCCHCGCPIDLSSILARTFCLKTQHVRHAEPGEYTKLIDVPELCDQMVIFHRHLECLFVSTKYVVISHVSHRDVAEAQQHREFLDDVANIIRNVLARVCQGVAAELGEPFEVWHDYISVPQWHPGAKYAIVPAIPSLFEQAMLPVVHVSDLDAATVERMRNPESTNDRCRAISNLCNLKWFSRVWTAMEFTESKDSLDDQRLHHAQPWST